MRDTTPPAIRSRNSQTVPPRTETTLNPSHSLKPAGARLRGPHTCPGVKALLGAPRGLSGLISVAYGLQPQKPNNWPPSIDSVSLASLATIVHKQHHRDITDNGIDILHITVSRYGQQRYRHITNNGSVISQITILAYAPCRIKRYWHTIVCFYAHKGLLIMPRNSNKNENHYY